jgi:uncharacterized repeat protein (TIGR02543 family)
VNVNKPDDNVLNVYFDRAKYKIAFDIGSYGWIYDKNTKRFVNGKDYVIDAWLDRPVVDEWPILSKERENSTEKEQSYINWKASKSFNSWSPAKGSGVSAAAATTQLVTDYEMINGAVNGNGTLVYTATTTGQYQTVKAVAHYILEGKESFSQDLMILEDREYNDVGSVYKKVNGVNVYTRLLAKEIEGYRNVTEATSSGYNPEEMAVYEGSNPVNLYFFYKKKGYNLKLMETDAKVFKSLNVAYATKLTGEDGYLATEKSIGIPTAPKAGVEFDCWSTTPSASAPYTANDGKMPAYDITLYARWKPIQVSIQTWVDGVITEYPARDYNTTLEEYEIPDP